MKNTDSMTHKERIQAAKARTNEFTEWELERMSINEVKRIAEGRKRLLTVRKD